MSVNLKKIEGYLPKNVLVDLPKVIEKYQFDTEERLSHFLAQCEHESAKFKSVRENLNYSEKGLKSIFGKYFPGDLAAEYERQPEKIANRVYANRMGNGDEKSGEGFKFRGRGFIQITGKESYLKLGKFLDEDLEENPDLVATDYPLESAGWFFKTRNLNAISDNGVDEETIRLITKKINGGYLGIEERIHFTEKFYDLLTR